MNKKYSFKALSVLLLTAIIGFPSVLAGPPGDGKDNAGTGETQPIETAPQNVKKSKRGIYGKGAEAKAIKEELGGFDASNSTAYREIAKHFGRDIRLSELLGIINSIKIYLQTKQNSSIPKISRNEKRSYPLLIKYIEKNSELILPYFQYINLCDDNFQKIPLGHNGEYGNLNPAPKTRINPNPPAGIAPSGNNAVPTMQQLPQTMLSLQPGFDNATRPNNTVMPQINYTQTMQQPVAAHSPIVKKFQYSPNRKIIKCNR